MTLNVPQIKINTPTTEVKTPVVSHEAINNNLSFGNTPKTHVVGKFTKDTIEWLGERSTPFNRFLVGATALMIQPFIDLYNKYVDEDTRKISCARAVAKAFVGTATGIVVRWGCIKSIDNLTRTPEELNELQKRGKKPTKWNTLLIPNLEKDSKGIKKIITNEEFGQAVRLVKKHRQTLGSIIALGVMLVTNFIIDAPLTKIMTNALADKYIKKSEQTKAEEKEGNNV